MSPCPCGSGHPLDACCGPLIEGVAAATPEALMRSRYAAYVLGRIDHVDRTHAPEIRGDFNRAEAERTAREIEWKGLQVLSASESGDTGRVEFSIAFRRDDRDLTQHEVATFHRIGGRWLYAHGEVSANHPPVRVDKVGRNEPCPCGSGRKYKKCCGA